MLRMYVKNSPKDTEDDSSLSSYDYCEEFSTKTEPIKTNGGELSTKTSASNEVSSNQNQLKEISGEIDSNEKSDNQKILDEHVTREPLRMLEELDLAFCRFNTDFETFSQWVDKYEKICEYFNLSEEQMINKLVEVMPYYVREKIERVSKDCSWSIYKQEISKFFENQKEIHFRQTKYIDYKNYQSFRHYYDSNITMLKKLDFDDLEIMAILERGLPVSFRGKLDNTDAKELNLEEFLAKCIQIEEEFENFCPKCRSISHEEGYCKSHFFCFRELMVSLIGFLVIAAFLLTMILILFKSVSEIFNKPDEQETWIEIIKEYLTN